MGVEMRGKINKVKACGCCDMRNGKKLYTNSKNTARKEIENGVSEYSGVEDCDHSKDRYMRNLYPHANSITSYWHDIFGYDVLVVDGVFSGTLESANSLISYAYFTGTQYKDREELETKFLNDLEQNNQEIGWWIP